MIETKQLDDLQEEFSKLFIERVFKQKEDVEDGFRFLVKAYAILYFWKIKTWEVLRGFELTDERKDWFSNLTRDLVLRGYASEEREKMRSLSVPLKIKEVENVRMRVETLLEVCRREESVLYNYSQILQLDMKMSNLGHQEIR